MPFIGRAFLADCVSAKVEEENEPKQIVMIF
jgi:hypothetical protein